MVKWADAVSPLHNYTLFSCNSSSSSPFLNFVFSFFGWGSFHRWCWLATESGEKERRLLSSVNIHPVDTHNSPPPFFTNESRRVVLVYTLALFAAAALHTYTSGQRNEGTSRLWVNLPISCVLMYIYVRVRQLRHTWIRGKPNSQHQSPSASTHTATNQIKMKSIYKRGPTGTRYIIVV